MGKLAADRFGGAAAKEAFRSGNPLPTALRKYPEAHIRMRDDFSKLMASGMSTFDVRKRVDATLGVEFRRKEPI
jgi:hypothetical protein